MSLNKTAPWHYEESYPIGEDALIVAASSVARLETRLSELVWRAVYYQDYPKTPDEFKGMIRELTDLLIDIRRSGQ